MFDLVMSNEVVGFAVDAISEIVRQQKIYRHYTYDMSSEDRSRKLTLDGGIDIRTKTIDIGLRYRSCPGVKNVR